MLLEGSVTMINIYTNFTNDVSAKKCRQNCRFWTFDPLYLLRFKLRSLQPLFTKLTKSHISAQYFVKVFVLGWYTYFESAQVLWSKL